MDKEKFIKKIRDVELGKYDMRANEIRAIYEYNTIDPIMAIIDAFRYGFLKGQRAANHPTGGQPT